MYMHILWALALPRYLYISQKGTAPSRPGTPVLRALRICTTQIAVAEPLPAFCRLCLFGWPHWHRISFDRWWWCLATTSRGRLGRRWSGRLRWLSPFGLRLYCAVQSVWHLGKDKVRRSQCCGTVIFQWEAAQYVCMSKKTPQALEHYLPTYLPTSFFPK